MITPEQQELLEKYSRWLEKYSYMDSDWWSEEPNAIERFIQEMKSTKE